MNSPRASTRRGLRDRSPMLYLRNARYGYLRWGADGKVRQLDQLYPHLRDARALHPSDALRSARRSSGWISRP